MDFGKEARKQYFRHFCVLFIVVGILLALTVGAGISRFAKSEAERLNITAPAERVYDYADILTEEEEQKLRAYIAEKEAKYKADFVILTISQPAEGQDAKEQYGYRSTNWTQNMMDIADDFWDENGYGFNKDFNGDGAILVDNRYEGQRGEHLGTSGKVENSLSSAAVEAVLYSVDRFYDSDPYKAYIAYIDKVCSYLDGGSFAGSVIHWLCAAILSFIAAMVYMTSHLKKNKAANTVAVNAYVVGGKPIMRSKGDDFIRKNVVTRRIETSSGSSGGHSGGGGHHVSRSGASHGGGSHRH